MKSRSLRTAGVLGACLVGIWLHIAYGDDHSRPVRVVDAYTLAGDGHFLLDYPATDAAGNLNVVVEIPGGTNQKWEVEKDTGLLKWEFKNGKPRIVSYLGYPGNYGMIPRTLLPTELGGDGDPLDVLVLGEPVPRGSVVSARLLGVLKMLDDGETDDKLIAVLAGSPLDGVEDMKALESEFPGASQIVEIWFRNYKGPGRIETRGYSGPDEASRILGASMAAFEERQQGEAAE